MRKKSLHTRVFRDKERGGMLEKRKIPSRTKSCLFCHYNLQLVVNRLRQTVKFKINVYLTYQWKQLETNA